MNQGLFYLDWLLDHRAEFALLAMKHLGPEVQEVIDWSSPRLPALPETSPATTSTPSSRSTGTSSCSGIATTARGSWCWNLSTPLQAPKI